MTTNTTNKKQPIITLQLTPEELHTIYFALTIMREASEGPTLEESWEAILPDLKQAIVPYLHNPKMVPSGLKNKVNAFVVKPETMDAIGVSLNYLRKEGKSIFNSNGEGE